MFVSQGNDPIILTHCDPQIRTESALSGPQTDCKDKIYLTMQ